MTKTAATTTPFAEKLAAYKQLIDEDITRYSAAVRSTTLATYGRNAELEIEAFLNILKRGGKRIRGALVILGYEMSGGTNQKMILHAARALEMFHAYILMIDDIQDRSAQRRGGLTAHIALADYHRSQKWTGDSQHFGISIALNGALAGAHAAQTILTGLDVNQQRKLNAISIVNRTMVITAHGQTYDIMYEAMPDITRDDIDHVMLWKTAEYTMLNPLCVGMVLAGAECDETDAIREYALNSGVAFQIIDDIIGVFGSEAETGKSPMDDIREGKRTVLLENTLGRASAEDTIFLQGILGSQRLTGDDFERCKQIMRDSGALVATQATAQKYIETALQSLEQESYRWSAEGVNFLRGLARYLADRTS